MPSLSWILGSTFFMSLGSTFGVMVLLVSLHEDQHTPPQMQDQVQGQLFLDNEIRKSAATIFQLLACKDEPLLLLYLAGVNALSILDLGLHIFNTHH